MTNWITISATDLDDYAVAELVDALQTEALAIGQSDPFPAIRDTVIQEVRAIVLSCSKNQVDTDTAKIPASLKSATMSIILARMNNRLNLKLNEQQQEEWKRANRVLDQVAACKLAIEDPDNALADNPTQSGGGVTVVESRDRLATGDKLKGL